MAYKDGWLFYALFLTYLIAVSPEGSLLCHMTGKYVFYNETTANTCAYMASCNMTLLDVA